MNLTRKGSQEKKVTLSGEFPVSLPQPPEELGNVPGVNEWKQSLEQWWYDFRTVLLRDRESLEDSSNGSNSEFESFRQNINEDMDEANTSIQSLVNQIAQIQADISKLKQENSFGNNLLNTQVASINSALAGKEDKSVKGIANGYPSLGANAKVPVAQLPEFLSGGPNTFLVINATTNDITGNFVVPAGVYRIFVELVAGGGGGGGETVGNNYAGLGGGGGGFLCFTMPVIPGQSIPYTVGKGGLGSKTGAGARAATDGTDSKFGFASSEAIAYGGKSGHESNSHRGIGGGFKFPGASAITYGGSSGSWNGFGIAGFRYQYGLAGRFYAEAGEVGFDYPQGGQGGYPYSIAGVNNNVGTSLNDPAGGEGVTAFLGGGGSGATAAAGGATALGCGNGGGGMLRITW